MPPEPAAEHSRAPWWVPTTYFAEGFPYSLVRILSTVFFKDAGASLEAIGLTSLYGLPWTLKFLWAPLVDTYATKRRWLLVAEGALVGLMLLLAGAATLSAALPAVAVMFLLLAVASATHDIAVDGYYLEALDRTRQARWVGFQAGFYRLALVAGGGGIVMVSGWTSFSPAFLVAAVVFGGIFALHLTALPRVEEPGRPAIEMVRGLRSPRRLTVALLAVSALVAGLAAVQRPEATALRNALARDLPRVIVVVLGLALAVLAVRAPALKRRLYASQSSYALAFVDYLDQPRVGVILAFVALYRTGESFLLNMAYPFLRDIGISRAAYGLAYGTFGIMASIGGGLLGGFLIARFGLKKCIWPFVLSQNVLNLLYMVLAIWYRPLIGHPELGAANPAVASALIVVEQFGAGLGTAAFMVFIMRTTRPDHKAAHFAIATGLATISATLAGVMSGFLAGALGFAAFFGFTFLATFPAMALIPFLPLLDPATSQPRPS